MFPLRIKVDDPEVYCPDKCNVQHGVIWSSTPQNHLITDLYLRVFGCFRDAGSLYKKKNKQSSLTHTAHMYTCQSHCTPLHHKHQSGTLHDRKSKASTWSQISQHPNTIIVLGWFFASNYLDAKRTKNGYKAGFLIDWCIKYTDTSLPVMVR